MKSPLHRFREQVRAGDPTRGVQLPDAPRTTAELIAYAMSDVQRTDGRMAPRRRSVIRRPALAFGFVVLFSVAAVSSAVVWASRSPTPKTHADTSTNDAADTLPPIGQVVQPVAYQVPADPAPARSRLEELADRIQQAPHERITGPYDFLHRKSWGSTTVMAPGGLVMSRVQETKMWCRSGDVCQTTIRELEPQYSSEEARAHWLRVQASLDPSGGPSTFLPGPTSSPPAPFTADDQARLSSRLRTAEGPIGAAKALSTLYSWHLLDTGARAATLRTLATVTGFEWRGQVQDRTGRDGVAITAGDTGAQTLLIFDPGTGELLAYEHVKTGSRPQVLSYILFLSHGRTDKIG